MLIDLLQCVLTVGWLPLIAVYSDSRLVASYNAVVVTVVGIVVVVVVVIV